MEIRCKREELVARRSLEACMMYDFGSGMSMVALRRRASSVCEYRKGDHRCTFMLFPWSVNQGDHLLSDKGFDYIG